MSEFRAPPFALHPGEQIIKQVQGTYLRSTFTGIGYNPMPGVATMTNYRLMFECITLTRRRTPGMNYSPVAFPLKPITHMTILPMKVQWSNEEVLRIEFENGGKEYFVFGSAPYEWQEALSQGQAQAPVLPYQTVPTTRPGVEGAVRRSWMFLGALIVGIPTACCILLLLMTLFSELFLS